MGDPLLIVTTCARRAGGVSYLASTLSELERVGALNCDRMVVSDGQPPDFDGGAWPSAVQGLAPGSRPTMWAALRIAASRNASRLLYFQDDVVPVGNLVNFMLRFPIPDDVGLVNLHDFGDFRAKVDTPPGWHRREAHDTADYGMCGAQCLILPGSIVKWLAGKHPSPPAMGKRTDSHADYALGWWVARSPRPVKLIRSPALIHHRGIVSAAHPDRETLGHRHPQAPAEPLAFDALALLSAPP